MGTKSLHAQRSAVLVMAVVILLFGTCDLFKVGFGEKVDLQAPEAAATSVVAGQYVRGVLTLTGTTTDDVGAVSVQVKPGSGDWVDAEMGEGGTWTATVDTTRLADGETTFILKATDAFPRSGEKSLFLYVDNTPPVVLVKNPVFNEEGHAGMTAEELATAYKYNQKVTVSGGAADNQRLRSVTMTAYALDGSQAADPVTIEGQFDWSASFTPPAGEDLADYIISVTALDYAGNQSARFYTADDIRAAFPDLSAVPPADELVLIERGQTISDISAAELVPLARPAGDDSGQYALIDPDSDKPQFIVSNPSEDGDESSNILSPLSRVVGMVLDDDGVDTGSLQIRYRDDLIPWAADDDTGWVPVSTVIGSGLSVRFDHSFNPYLTSGTYLVQVAASDVNGLRSSGQPIAFRVEASASVINFQSHRTGQYVNGSQPIALAGTASDPDGLALVEILFDIPGQSFTEALGTDSWSLTSALDAADLQWTTAGSGVYGTYAVGEIPVVIRVTDSTGQESMDMIILLVDMESPSIEILTPDLSVAQNGVISLQGIGQDDVKLDSLTMTCNGAAGTNLGNSYAWRYNIDTTALTATTGTYPIVITARDAAGNISTENLSLLVDQSMDLPEVEYVDMDPSADTPGEAGLNLRESSAKIRLSFMDDDALDPASVQIEFDASGTWRTMDSAAGFESTSISTVQIGATFSISVDPADANYLSQGVHSFRVRASDLASAKSGLPAATYTTAAVYFAIDRDSPVISGIQVDGADYEAGTTAYANGDYSLSGLATDNQALESVVVERSADSGSSWTTVATLSSSPWTYTHSSPAEGSYLYRIIAWDTVDKESNPAMVTVTMDTQAPGAPVIETPGTGYQAGSEVTAKATASDAGAAGIEAVYVYLGDYGVAAPAGTAGWTAAVQSSGSWIATPSLGAEGHKTLHFRSVDRAGNLGSADATVSFWADQASPQAEITTPASGVLVNGGFAAAVTASDSNGISGVLFRLLDANFDTDPGDNRAATFGSGTWNYTFTSGDMAAVTSGSRKVYARATDSSGRTVVASLDFIFDVTDPSASVFSPSSSALLNGAVSIKGTTTDNYSVGSVEYQMGLDTDGPDNVGGNADDWQDFSSLYNWQLDIASIDDYANATYSTWDAGTETWDFVFHVRATDSAGNVTLYDHPMILDPAGDSPRVSILQPADSSIVGGTIRLIGSAIDDDEVDLVQVRINRNAGFGAGPATDTDFTDVTDFWDGTVDGPDASTDDLWEDESIWVDATPSSAGNWSNWYLSFNSAKEFNTDGAETDPRWIQIQVRARDINGKYGSPVAWNLRIDSRIPSVESLYLDTDSSADLTPNGTWGTAYSQGMVTRGQVWLRGLIRDQGGFDPTGKIEVEWDSPSLAADRIDDEAGKTTFDGDVGGYDQYRMHLAIDTDSAGYFQDSTGEMRLTIVAYDNSDPQFVTREQVRINVDNVYPESDFDGVAGTIVGNEYRLAGTATDSGDVASVSYVIAYLVRGGNVLVIKPGEAEGQTGIAATLSALNMDGTPVVENVLFPSLADNRYFVQVDRADDLSTGNLDGDGYKENFTATAGGREWEAYIDSELVDDGEVDVHYVVFDHVGNATHYQHTADVRNHPPVIGTVTLGTDLDGDGSTNESLEERPAAFSFGASTDLATGFTARNNRLYVSIGQSELSPNGTLTYTAMIGAVNLKTADSSPNTTEPGYSDFVADGIGDASNVAVVLRVTDSLGYYDERTVRVDLDNVDGTPAEIAVAPFGWTYPNEESDDDKASTEAVFAYTDNIVMDGTTELGHIEYAEDSPWTNSTIGALADSQADVSGRVIFKGKAYDNQRIQSIAAQIPGFDGGAGAGNAFTIASWSGGALVSSNTAALDLTNHWNMELPADEAYLTQAEGHVVNWNFSWDSAYITGVADDDVTVTFSILDFGTSPAASDPITVDIVPYISAISTPKRTSGGLKDVNIRSSDGNYSIIVGADATFTTVSGFNLNPNAVRVVSSTVVDDTLVTAASGADLADSGVAAGYGSFSLSNAGTVSGYLEVFTNGQRSLNNINDNDAQGDYPGTGVTAMYNREPDLYIRNNPRLTDDRYIRFFSMKDTGVKNGYYPEMVMVNDDPTFGFVNMTGGPGTAVSLAPATGAGSYYGSHAMPQRARFDGATGAEETTEYLIKASIWDQMAMARDEGGRFIHASVYNRDGCSMSILYDRYAELYTNGMGWGSGIGYSGYSGDWSDNINNNAITIEATDFGNGLLLGRFQYPKMIAKGNSVTGDARIYMLYYDDNTTNSDLIFRNFRIGTTAGLGNQLYSGGTSSDGVTAYAQYSNVADYNETGRLTAASGASKYFDFAVTSGNIVVIVYYDETAGRLMMRYSAAAVDGSSPTSAVSWTDSSVTFPDYVGNYVSLALDDNDGVHISAYDAGESDLTYMYLSSPSSTTLHAVTVDQAFAVGNWTKIKILEPVADTFIPYIAYYNATETGGRDAIKLAYCKTGISGTNVPEGVDGTSGETTGDWEYLTVPAITPPQGGDLKFKQVNLGFDTADRPVVGYLGTNLEFGSWLDE